MRKKILLTIFFLMVTAGALTFNKQIFSKSNSAHHPAAPVQQTRTAQALPEHVPYMFLFHHLIFLKQKADEFEQQGKGRSSLLTRFQEDAKLTDTQFQTLYQIASDCEQKVAEQDRKAMAIINAMKAAYPGGRLPKGAAPPPVPPELITMQQERDTIILQARDRLHRALGEQAFVQFNGFVQSHIASEIKPDIPQ